MKFHKPGQGSSGPGAANFLKIKDGEGFPVVFRGEPVEFFNHFGKQVCDGKGKPCCAEFGQATFRFRINCLVQENGAWVAKVLEQGRTVYDALSGLNEEYPLEDHIVKISRKGSQKSDTTYALVPARDGVIGPERKKQFDAIPLLDISPRKKDSSEPVKTKTNEAKNPNEISGELPF